MKTRFCMTMLIALLVAGWAAMIRAGDLNVAGNLNVSNNISATSFTLGADTRTNWPSGSGGTFLDLGNNPVLASPAGLYSIVLTNHAVWDFGAHNAGRAFRLKIAQDGTGGWTNAWSSDVLWPGGVLPSSSTQSNQFDLFRFVDDGVNWLGVVEGLNFALPGSLNFALRFSGANYAAVAYNSDLYPQSGLTFEAWLRTTSAGNMNFGNLDFPGGGYGGYQLQLYGGQASFGIANATTFDYVRGGPSLADGQWHHIAGVWDSVNGTISVYADGALVDSHSYTAGLGDTQSNLLLGAVPYNQALYWIGDLDEVRISNSARYTTESFSLECNLADDANTVALWKFNEGYGTVASEAHNHTATLSDPPPAWVDGVIYSVSQNSMMMGQTRKLSSQLNTSSQSIGQTNQFTVPTNLRLTPSNGTVRP